MCRRLESTSPGPRTEHAGTPSPRRLLRASRHGAAPRSVGPHQRGDGREMCGESVSLLGRPPPDQRGCATASEELAPRVEQHRVDGMRTDIG